MCSGRCSLLCGDGWCLDELTRWLIGCLSVAIGSPPVRSRPGRRSRSPGCWCGCCSCSWCRRRCGRRVCLDADCEDTPICECSMKLFDGLDGCWLLLKQDLVSDARLVATLNTPLLDPNDLAELEEGLPNIFRGRSSRKIGDEDLRRNAGCSTNAQLRRGPALRSRCRCAWALPSANGRVERRTDVSTELKNGDSLIQPSC